MNFSKFLFIGLFSLLFLFHSYCQKIKVVRDFRLIQEAGMIKSLTKKLEINFGTKLLLEQNASKIGELDLDLGLSYKFFKFLSTGLEYRFSENRNQYDDFVIKNRLRADISFIARTGRLKTDYRICYQNIDDEFFQYNDSVISRNIIRNRFQFKYNIKNFSGTPFFYFEHYGQLGESADYGIKLKSAVGLEYSINKSHNLKVYYRFDKELNQENPYFYSSIGFGYGYIF